MDPAYLFRNLKFDIPISKNRTESELAEKAPIRKSQRTGILDQIENLFTGGYGKKEDLRELDKALRDDYSVALRDLRHDIEKTYLAAIKSNQVTTSAIFKEATQTLDRVTYKINRADYGYAGLLNRTSKIRENALNRVLGYDRGLKASMDTLTSAVREAESVADMEAWPRLKESADQLRKTIRDLEAKWTARETALNETGG